MARAEETVTIWNIDYPEGRVVAWGSGTWITVPPAGEGVTLTGLNVIYRAKRLVESVNNAVNRQGRLSLEPPFEGAAPDELSKLKLELARQEAVIADLLNRAQSAETEVSDTAEEVPDEQEEVEIEIVEEVKAPRSRARSKKGN